MLPYAGLHGNFLRNTCCSGSLGEVLSLCSLKTKRQRAVDCLIVIAQLHNCSSYLRAIVTLESCLLQKAPHLLGAVGRIRLDNQLLRQRGVKALTCLALTVLRVASFHHPKDILLPRLVFGFLQSIAQHSPRRFTAG